MTWASDGTLPRRTCTAGDGRHRATWESSRQSFRSYPRSEAAWSPGTESHESLRKEGSHGNSQGGETRRVAQGTEEAPGEGEGVHPDARPAEPGAARSALGARREAIHLRERARDADAQRRLRGTRPAGHLSRDVQSGHRGGSYALDSRRALLRLLLLDGQLQRHHRPPEPPRHHNGRGLTGSLPEACRLQETDGLELSVAVIARKRLQFRLSRLFHRSRGEGRL